MCHKHLHKRAKYIVIESTPDFPEYLNRYYCSRCAIKLVTKGLKVEELCESLSEEHEKLIPQEQLQPEQETMYQEEMPQEELV